MDQPKLCKDCPHQNEGKCVRFNFAADMREDPRTAWCKSWGKNKED